MNFEIKSTFNKSIENTVSSLKRFLLKLTRIDHSAWLLTINVTGFVVTGWLYLENILIPATYGSRPNGDNWINGLTAAGYVWAITTSHALCRVVFLYTTTRTFQHRLIQQYKDFGLYLRDAIQMLVLQSYMLIHLFLQEPKRSRYQIALALNPRTYINYILTK